MVSFILSVAIVNVGVGFALAIYLGWRYRHLVALEMDSSPDFLGGGLLEPAFSGQAPPSAADPIAPALFDPPADPDEWEQPDAAPPVEAAESHETADPPGAEVETSPETPERHPTEIAMTELRGRVNRYQEQMIDVDSLLRQFRETPDPPRMEACLQTLHQSNEEYLTTRGEAYQHLQESQAKAGFTAPAFEDLHAAVEAQTERIEAAQVAAASIDYQGDLANACQRMTDQTVQLADANHVVRDALAQAWAAASAAEKWQTPVDESRSDGLMAELVDRAALEAAFSRWRDNAGHSAQPLCMAAIDLDQFARVNERYGLGTGDRLLHALAQLLVREGSHNNLVGRVSGQRFVVLFPEVDLRFTTSVVERIRQMIEISRFQYRDQDVQVTVSCAVVEARLEDNFVVILARADAAIQEAKRYGRNRTFLHEGEYPTPVVPPNFALQEKCIAL